MPTDGPKVVEHLEGHAREDGIAHGVLACLVEVMMSRPRRRMRPRPAARLGRPETVMVWVRP